MEDILKVINPGLIFLNIILFFLWLFMYIINNSDVKVRKKYKKYFVKNKKK